MNTETGTTNNGQRMSAEDRKRQLAEAALRVFSARGFSGATTREIANAAGVSEAVIFQHFNSKEELYTSILDEKTSRIFSRQWLAELKELAENNEDNRIFEAIAAKITEFAEQSGLVRLVLYSALEGHEIVREFRRRQMLPVYEFLRDYIIKRQNNGAFQMCDANIAARAFLGAQIYHATAENLFSGELQGFSKDTASKNFACFALDGLRRRDNENESKNIFTTNN